MLEPGCGGSQHLFYDRRMAAIMANWSDRLANLLFFHVIHIIYIYIWSVMLIKALLQGKPISIKAGLASFNTKITSNDMLELRVRR